MHLHISYEVPDWNQGCYRDVAPVIPAARAWQMVHHDTSDIAVVLLGGYCGYPGELVRPGIDLYDRGYDVFCPREPGCGTSAADFQHTGWRDWYQSAENCYLDVRSRYQIVYVAGHSMGGLTAIRLAHRALVTRLVLLAPALDVAAFHEPGSRAIGTDAGSREDCLAFGFPLPFALRKCALRRPEAGFRVFFLAFSPADA